MLILKPWLLFLTLAASFRNTIYPSYKAHRPTRQNAVDLRLFVRITPVSASVPGAGGIVREFSQADQSGQPAVWRQRARAGDHASTVADDGQQYRWIVHPEIDFSCFIVKVVHEITIPFTIKSVSRINAIRIQCVARFAVKVRIRKSIFEHNSQSLSFLLDIWNGEILGNADGFSTYLHVK